MRAEANCEVALVNDGSTVAGNDRVVRWDVSNPESRRTTLCCPKAITRQNPNLKYSFSETTNWTRNFLKNLLMMKEAEVASLDCQQHSDFCLSWLGSPHATPLLFTV